MTNTDPSQIQVGNIPWPPGHEPLWAQLKDWIREGLSLELIVALVMSNPNGTGAMDVASQSVAGITKQYQELCDVQSDIITIDSILSKIESELGNSNNPDVTDPTKNPNLLKELQDLQAAYRKLFVTPDKDGNLGDFGKLQKAAETDPDLNMVIAKIQGFETDFSGANNTSNDVWKNITNKPSDYDPNKPPKFNFGNDLNNWDGQTLDVSKFGFATDVEYLAAEHYDANHTSSGPTPMAAATGDSDLTDILKNWWTDGDSSQSVTSGQSQQDTTRVQSLMQILQSFGNTGQQILQSAGAQKTQMVTNQKTQ